MLPGGPLRVLSDGQAGTTDFANAEQLQTIGAVSVNFSALEFLFWTLAWEFIGETKAGQIVTAQRPFNRLLDLVGALGAEKLHNASVLKELGELIQEARKCEQERNLVIHSIWVADLDDPKTPLRRMKITARGRLNVQHEGNVSVDRIYEVADLIELVRAKLMLHAPR